MNATKSRLLIAFVMAAIPLTSLVLPARTQASALRDAYHQAIPRFENFLTSIDDIDAVLWTGTSFSEQQVWETILHSALAAKSPVMEAHAQQALVRLGLTKEEIVALYRLDPNVYSDKQIATWIFAQRSAVLPTKVNAVDINELRKYYSHKEVTELAMINAYVVMFSVLYGTGYVRQNPTLAFDGLSPQLIALQQKKDTTAKGWTERHYFESPLIALELSLPFIDLDGVMLEEPHSFTRGELWEMFVVGQRASDCKHCITHGAFGMHLAYRTHEDIIAAYHYDGTAKYTPRQKARLDFVKNALRQPSTVTAEHREALAALYSDLEVQHLVGITSFMAMLSSYMQITGVITDNESAGFATKVLGPEGFDMGRHVGPSQQQRRMHPITLYRLTPGGNGVERTLLFSKYVMRAVMLGDKFPLVPGPVLHGLLQLLFLGALVTGYRKVTAR